MKEWSEQVGNPLMELRKAFEVKEDGTEEEIPFRSIKKGMRVKLFEGTGEPVFCQEGCDGKMLDVLDVVESMQETEDGLAFIVVDGNAK